MFTLLIHVVENKCTNKCTAAENKLYIPVSYKFKQAFLEILQCLKNVKKKKNDFVSKLNEKCNLLY